MAEVSRRMATPTAAVCAEVARALDAVPPGVLPWPEVRVAVLASVTAAPLAPFVSAIGAQSGVLVRTHVADGDQWEQEVLDPSSDLRQFAPDVLVVALQLEDLSPALVHEYLGLDRAGVDSQIAETVARVGNLLENIRRWSSAKILLHSFPLPIERSLGVLDDVHERGQTQAIGRVDRSVRERAAALRDVYVIDLARLIARVGYDAWHDARMWTLARIPWTAAATQALAEEYLRFLRAFSGRARKVLALDLDNTLWGGIVGEDGVDGLQLGVGYKGRAYVELQRVARELMRRGVLLAINSQNNPDDALEVIDGHQGMVLRRNDFAAMRINWQDKAANLVELSEELGLALDSFVFVDDNAAECERVRQALPEVWTVHLTGDPVTYAATLRGLGAFDVLSFGQEDQMRTAMYRSEVDRRALQESMPSLEGFLQSLEMQLDIEEVGPKNLPRAAELTQRTNQFNLTTRRYTQDELRDYLARPGHDGFVFRLRDRFGDHGIIGLALAERLEATLAIDTLLLSCRVLKRTVEASVLSFLVDHARAAGAAIVEGRYLPTRKNAVAASLYQSYGFDVVDDEESSLRRFTRPTSEDLPPSPWIASHRLERRPV